MLELLKHIRKRWEDWCGDHDMEVTIRKHLTENGFFGGTAKLRNVWLVRATPGLASGFSI